VYACNACWFYTYRIECFSNLYEATSPLLFNNKFEINLKLNCLVLSGLIVSEGLRKSWPNMTIFLQKFSLNLIAYIYLLVKFLFCLFLCFLFHVYLLPVMANKDIYIACVSTCHSCHTVLGKLLLISNFYEYEYKQLLEKSN